MIRRPPRSTQSRSSAASYVYKRQHHYRDGPGKVVSNSGLAILTRHVTHTLSLIHISEPTETRHDLVCRLLLEKKNNTPHPPLLTHKTKHNLPYLLITHKQ